MGKFLLRRFISSLILVALAASLGYVLAALSLNPRANFEGRNPPPPQASINKTLNELNLNDKTPLEKRFFHWAGGVLHGDFGKTIAGEPVTSEMGRRIGVSLRLLLIATVLGGMLGVVLGVVSAAKQYHWSDHTATFLSFVILSTPVFLLCVLLKYGGLNVNQHLHKQVFYYVGETTPGLGGGWWHHGVDRVQHLILPTLALMLAQIAFYSRYQRSCMLDVLGSDFLRTAQAKGLRRRDALIRHGLRTALIPMSTFFAYEFGLLITGATFTEKIFGWHGMGEWFIDAISKNDVNVVAVFTLFSAILILIAGLLADLALAALDPRVRIS